MPGGDRLYLRGSIWWGWVYDQAGKRVPFSTQCTSYRAARAALARKERETQTADPPGTLLPAHSLSEALDYLLDKGCLDCSPETVDMYRSKALHLRKHLGAHDVKDITADDIRAYISIRQQQDQVSSVTVHKELVTLRRALTLARERKLLDVEPAAVMPAFKVKYQPRTRYLTEKEFELLVDQLPEKRVLWVLIAVLAAGRSSEVERLSWTDVDFNAKTITLPGTKTEKSRRTIPLSSALASVLIKHRKNEGAVVEQWLNVRRDLADACDRAHIARVSPNDLRRTFASWLKQRGEDSWVVAQMMGHTTSRMVELVYGRLNKDTFRRAIDTLDVAAGVTASATASSVNHSRDGSVH